MLSLAQNWSVPGADGPESSSNRFVHNRWREVTSFDPIFRREGVTVNSEATATVSSNILLCTARRGFVSFLKQLRINREF